MGSEHASVVLAVLGWWFTALSTLLVVVCVLASRGSIHVNRYFGLKLPALLQSDSAWRKGHAAAIVPSAAMAAVGLTCAIIGISTPVAYWGSIGAFVIGVAWSMSAATRAARAMSR